MNDNFEQAFVYAKSLTTNFWHHWPRQTDLFPDFHTVDADLERAVTHVHQVHGLGVGAFSGQAVETLGPFPRSGHPRCAAPVFMHGLRYFFCSHNTPLLKDKATRGFHRVVGP